MISIVIVCEAPADRNTAADLADRVILERTNIDEDSLQNQREWRGISANETHLEWRSVNKLAKQIGLRFAGKGLFQGRSGYPDASTARNAILLLKRLPEQPDAVVFIRDGDHQSEERKIGLNQARNEAEVKKIIDFPIVIGLAKTKRECWILAGFEPQNERERKRLEAERKSIESFDPISSAHKMTGDDNDPKDPKRLVKSLCGGDRHREERCWKETALSVLKTRGNETGLTEYLDEVEAKLTPIFIAK